MNDKSSNFYTEVQRHLNATGQSVTLTADERDIVDDYETQQFSAEACAAQIAAERV